MIYRRENANNPSKRFRSVILNPIGSNILRKFFYKNQSNKNSTHFGKKLCKRRKKSIYNVKFNFSYCNILTNIGVITDVSLARRYKTFAALIRYSNGAILCIPAFNGAIPGKMVETWEYFRNPKLSFYSSIKLGYTLPLAYLNLTMCFFNIQFNNNLSAYFCKSAGTFCVLIRYDLEKRLCTIKLPSNKYKNIIESSYVMLGRNSNPLPRGIWKGKAGFNIKNGFRPIVRGVAKNPVDHPHGGRTKTNSPERTPWGRVAKHNK